MELKGSRTEQNLKDAFAGESQANRRYLYFANKADIEGQNDVAALFRSTAEGETGHAHGHLEFLEHGSGDPATGLPIGGSRRTCRPPSRVRPTSTPTCTPAWPSRRAKKASTRSPTGSKPWPRPSARMPTATPRRSKRWPTDPIVGALRHPMTNREGNLEAPTRHPVDWKNPEFYDAAACDKEMARIFDICHGCRRCVSLCDAFPTLFDLVDESEDGRSGRAWTRSTTEGRRPVLPVRPVLHDQVPLRAAASVERGFPAHHAAREGHQVQEGRGLLPARSCWPRPTCTASSRAFRSWCRSSMRSTGPSRCASCSTAR